MILSYVAGQRGVERVEIPPEAALPGQVLWYDLYMPTAEERARIEGALAVRLPEQDKMREIEPSSRLYSDGEASYMTATVLAHSDDPNPTSDPITFILARRSLVTLRYTDPRPIASYAQKLMRHAANHVTGEEVLVGLLEAFVDRLADILERVGLDNDSLSRAIFDDRASTARRRQGGRRDLQVVLKSLGRSDDLCSNVRESLLSLTRLLRFLNQTIEALGKKEAKGHRARLDTVRGDIDSLSEHAAFEQHKVNFLLDATLGMINVEQNRIIKIFSVAAVIFLPPTLVASVYGMNFRAMPELEWLFGYPWAIALMAVSAVLPFLYFRRKGWL